MNIRSIIGAAMLGALGCGGISGIDYQPYNCGGKTCAADEACVTRSYLTIYVMVPVYSTESRCEKRAGLGVNSAEPYWVRLPDGRALSRTEYIALPDDQKAKNADGTLRDPDQIWKQLTGR
jgi:hypothetical protein